MNYYPFHIGDYASSTRHLSWDEDLAYRRLIDAYYTREAPIPSDKRAAYRLVCATTETQREAVDIVLNEFFRLIDGWWTNSRCDEEINAAAIKREKASQSAKVRWSNANAERTQCERNANASSEPCERIDKQCDGNAPNPNPNPNISTDVDIKEKRVARFDAHAHLSSLGVHSQIAMDWIAHRKAKNATPTRTAIDGIAREAGKAGMPLSEALALCCERGWTGFKAEWIANDKPVPVRPINGRQAAISNYAAQAAEARAKHDFSIVERDITGEAIRVA